MTTPIQSRKAQAKTTIRAAAPRARRLLRRAAYHEAGHVLARQSLLRWPATAVENQHDGSGLSKGTGEVMPLRGQYECWDFVVYCLSGCAAEARYAHVSLSAAVIAGGSDDLALARPIIDNLVQDGFAQSQEAAWRRATMQSRAFVRREWASIERVAAALIALGVLSPTEIERLAARELVPK